MSIISTLATNFRPEVRTELIAEYERWARDVRYYCQVGGRFEAVNQEKALVAAALAIFSRRVVLVVGGVAQFQRRLQRSNIRALRIGNTMISSAKATSYEDASAGFHALVAMLQIEPELLEAQNAFKLLEAMSEAAESGGADG